MPRSTEGEKYLAPPQYCVRRNILSFHRSKTSDICAIGCRATDYRASITDRYYYVVHNLQDIMRTLSGVSSATARDLPINNIVTVLKSFCYSTLIIQVIYTDVR